MKNNILNLFGLGKIKFSASLSSLIALFFFFLLRDSFDNNLFVYISAFLLILLIVLFEIKKNMKDAISDSKQIVIDEFLGMFLLSFLVNSGSIILNIFLFLIFRIIDLVKVWPFFYLEKIEGRYSFLLDDIAIGFSIGIIYLVMASLI